MKQKLIPVTTGTDFPDFAIKNWREVEKSYGAASFPKDLRRAIEEATRSYLALTAMENGAAPLNEATREFALLLQDAKKLREGISSLTRRHAGSGRAQDIKYLILHKLGIYLRLKKVRPLGDQVATLLDSLTTFSDDLDSLQKALKRSLHDLGNSDEELQRKGREWDRWVLNLDQILIRAERSTSVNKDGVKPSPFVGFVRALQAQIKSQIPEYYLRDQTDGALAQAIIRAKRSAR